MLLSYPCFSEPGLQWGKGRTETGGGSHRHVSHDSPDLHRSCLGSVRPKVRFSQGCSFHCQPVPWPVANLQILLVYNSAFAMLGLWKLHFSFVSWHPARFCQRRFLEGGCSGPNFVPCTTPNAYFEVLMPNVSEYDCIWRQGL